MMDNITKKQHYVPKAYLRFFANMENKTYKTFVYFCKNMTNKYISIDNICCEKFLYEQIISYPHEKGIVLYDANSIEKTFVDLEGSYHTICENIMKTACENIIEILKEERYVLELFVSTLIFRGPKFVEVTKNISSDLYVRTKERLLSSMQEIYEGIQICELKAALEHEILNECVNSKVSVWVKAMQKTFEESQLVLLKSEGAHFITSDMPVINLYGEENGEKFDLVGLPITPNLFLAFIDIGTTLPNVINVDNKTVMTFNEAQLRKGTTCLIAKDQADFSSILQNFK